MSAIILQCILLRKGGTTVEMSDNTAYHFKDDGLGNHVAAISNMDHVQTLLGIPEAYRIFSAGQTVAPADAVGATAPVVQAAAVPAAPPPAPVVPPAPLTPPVVPPTTEPKPSTDGDAGQNVGAQTVLDPTADIETIRAAFRLEVGREPNARAKAETMIAQIEAVREERAGK